MRSKLTFLIFFISILSAFNQEPIVNFLKSADYEQALAIASQNKQKVFLDFSADWCLPCKQMDNSTFKDYKVCEYLNSKYITVKIDVSFFEGMDLADKYSVTEYPTLILLNHKGRKIKTISGFQSASQLLKFLK